MNMAYKEAEHSYKLGEIPVGCVIVKNNIVISKAHNCKEKYRNAIMHAELLAVDKACKKINDWRLDDCELYTTLEPCMMCMGAILYEGISKVVYAATLQDSNDYYCEEVITDIDVLSKFAKERIKIIKELHRDKAIEVLKKAGTHNT